MDRQYIDDHHIVARYLADQLADHEREAFELYYLEHPETVREMEAVSRFKVGLSQLRESGELADLMKVQPWYRRMRFTGYAAALAALTIGSYFLTSNLWQSYPGLAASLSELSHVSGKQLAIAGSYQILRTRGRAVDAAIELPAAAAAIELRTLPEFEAQPAHYRIVFSRENEDGSIEIVGETGGLVPARDGFVSTLLDSRHLRPGEYKLVISGDKDTDARDANSTFVIGVRRR